MTACTCRLFFLWLPLKKLVANKGNRVYNRRVSKLILTGAFT